MGDSKNSQITEIGKFRANGYGAIQTETTAAADREFAKMSPEAKKRARDLIGNYHAPGVNPEGLNHTYKGMFVKGDADGRGHGTRPNELPTSQTKEVHGKDR